MGKKENNARWYQKNKEKLRKKYQENKEEIARKYQENKEEIAKKYQKNKKKIAKKYQENKEELKRKANLRYQENKEEINAIRRNTSLVKKDVFHYKNYVAKKDVKKGDTIVDIYQNDEKIDTFIIPIRHILNDEVNEKIKVYIDNIIEKIEE